jgi:hypothetical protein
MADRLLPYLQRIGKAHWYTNRGDLVCELVQRLSYVPGEALDALASVPARKFVRSDSLRKKL